MKKLSESELQVMMIIWDQKPPITRIEISQYIEKDLCPTTILSFLSRLEKKGFIRKVKVEKNNLYYPIITKESYLQKESKRIFNALYNNSLKNFINALYVNKTLSEEEITEIQDFINEKKYIK